MMYLLYIDESGVVDLSGGTNHFVLCGLAIPAEDWKRCDSKINLLKSKYRLQDVELHAGWMARRYVEQEKIASFESLTDLERRNKVEQERKQFLRLTAATKSQKQLREKSKQYSKTSPFIHLTLNERINCLRDAADELSKWQNARLFAEAIDKVACGYSPDTIFENAFSQVITRFQTFLDNRGRAIQEDLSGLVIQDNNPTVSLKLTKLMRKYHKHGTIWRDITRIVETPLFVDSELTSMVQLADLCAYSIRRFFDANEDDFFNRFYSRFDRSGERVVGIRHYTGSKSYDCRVCKDHCRQGV